MANKRVDVSDVQLEREQLVECGTNQSVIGPVKFDVTVGNMDEIVKMIDQLASQCDRCVDQTNVVINAGTLGPILHLVSDYMQLGTPGLLKQYKNACLTTSVDLTYVSEDTESKDKKPTCDECRCSHMTLEEAIEHCYDVAGRKSNEHGISACGKQHLQLAEWLKELRAYYSLFSLVDAVNLHAELRIGKMFHLPDGESIQNLNETLDRLLEQEKNESHDEEADYKTAFRYGMHNAQINFLCHLLGRDR